MLLEWIGSVKSWFHFKYTVEVSDSFRSHSSKNWSLPYNDLMNKQKSWQISVLDKKSLSFINCILRNELWWVKAGEYSSDLSPFTQFSSSRGMQLITPNYRDKALRFLKTKVKISPFVLIADLNSLSRPLTMTGLLHLREIDRRLWVLVS